MSAINLSTYTETDPSSYVTVTSTDVSATLSVTSSSGTRVVKDYGVDYFDDLYHSFTAIEESRTAATGSLDGVVYQNADNAGSLVSAATTDLFICVNDDGGALNSRVILMRGNFIAFDYADFPAWGVNPYYLTLVRVAGSDTASLNIYSDSGRTVLVDTLTISGFAGATWRYHAGFKHFQQASPAQSHTITYSDFNFVVTIPAESTSRWPAAVAGNGALFSAVNNLSTTLVSGIDDVTTIIELASAADFPTSGYVTIGTEAIYYNGRADNVLLNVVRGSDNTAAAAHSAGTSVNHYAVADHHNAIKDEVIAVETQLAAEMVATKEPTGFPDASTTTISVVDGTRTFTVAPTGASFDVYVQGKKFTKTSESVTFTDTEGVWFFYYNSAGTLTSSQTAWSLINDAPVALLYWDATNNVSLDLANERHGCSMDGATHQYLHNTVGARFGSGLAASGYVINSAVNADVRFAFDAGSVYDEDLKIDIAAKTEPAQIPVFYRSGLAGMWRRAAATDYPYLTTGTGRIAYNLDTAGTWSQAEVNNGDFAAYWIFATNGANYPIIAIQGQRQDTSLANAQNNNLYESLAFGTLPYAEMKLLYRVIVQTSNAYGSTMKVRVSEVQDLRSVSNLPSGSYVATDHNSLTGRSTAASHPATAISNTPAGTIAATDVQAAIDELDTEKVAKAGDTMTGALDISNGSLSLTVGADNNASTRTDATAKLARIGGAHYTNAEEPVGLIGSSSVNGANSVLIGGGSGSVNAATSVVLYTAANSTTTSGTARLTVDSVGNVGIGTAPATTLHVDSAGGAIIRATKLGSGPNVIQIEADGTDGTLRSDGALILSAGGSEKARISSAGLLTVPGVHSNTDASAANVYVDSSGNLKRSTASSGGGGTVNSGTQYELAYYAFTGTAVSTTAGLSWGVAGSRNLTVDGTGNTAAKLQLLSATADAQTSFGTTGGVYYSIGCDYSDSSRLKISNSLSLGSSDVLRMTPQQIETGMAGSAATPAIVFDGDVDTGFYRSASNEVAVSCAGSQVLKVAAGGITATVAGNSDIVDLNGSSSGTLALRMAPSGASSNSAKIVATLNGTDTDLALRTGGTDNVIVKANGRVGINRSPANYRLEVAEGDANTNITQYPFALVGTTTGTAAAGLGVAQVFACEASDGSVYDVGYLEFNQTAVSSGSQSVDVVIKARKAGSFTTFFTLVGATGYLRVPGVYGQTTASSANVFVDSSGNIMRSTSSLRYKTEIKEVAQDEAAKLLDLTPVTYASMCEADNKEERHYGFIAEELDLLDPALVNYKTLEDGTKVPDGVQYERVVVGLLKLVQDLTARVKALEEKAVAPVAAETVVEPAVEPPVVAETPETPKE